MQKVLSILKNSANIAAAFLELAGELKDAPLYSQVCPVPGSGKRLKSIAAFSDALDRVRRISAFLKQCGLKKGERVAIVSSTRPEHMEADLGILCAGGVVVPVYSSLPAPDVTFILADAGARIVFVENEKQFKKVCVEGLAGSSQAAFKPAHVIVFDDDAEVHRAGTSQQVYSWRQALETPPLPRENCPGLECVWHDTAAIVYTSGATGTPRGVVHSHSNILANVVQCCEAGVFRPGQQVMLVLPLAHAFARLVGYLGFLGAVKLQFCAVVTSELPGAVAASVQRDFAESDAHIFPVVPRLLEKMREGLLERANGSALTSRLLKATITAAQSLVSARENHQRAGISLILGYGLSGPMRHLIKKRLFGRRFAYAVSGGARLSAECHQFFEMLGIKVYEGYGLTEACVAVTANRPGYEKRGSVGELLSPAQELKISTEGEILLRGPNVAAGYFERPDATAAVWDADGWLHTGDLGAVDSKGFLTITGRKKEIIVTSNGKKIAPEKIEGLLQKIEGVSQAFVLGDGRPCLSALLVLNESCGRRDLKAEIAALNAQLPGFEQVKSFLPLSEPFSVEAGLLTPTLKLKRSEIMKRYAREVERLYASPSGAAPGG